MAKKKSTKSIGEACATSAWAKHGREVFTDPSNYTGAIYGMTPSVRKDFDRKLISLAWETPGVIWIDGGIETYEESLEWED